MIGAIHGHDIQLYPWADVMRVVRQGVIIAPQDRLGFQSEHLSNTKNRVTLFDRVGNDFCSWAGGNRGVD